jgi:hypothetical protein
MPYPSRQSLTPYTNEASSSPVPTAWLSNSGRVAARLTPVYTPADAQPAVVLSAARGGRFAGFATPAAMLSLMYAAIGFSPIAALTLSIAGILPLKVGATLLVGLAIAAALVLAGRFPTYHQVALEGFAAGLLAVALYDGARWITIGFGWWGDFIPSIGGWLLGTNEPDVFLGYLFRWLGDGGGMGLAFLVAARSLVPAAYGWGAIRLGIMYGIAIWACLLVTLLAVPAGQTLLFPLTPTTFVLSLGGHLIYGGVLGAWLARRRVPTIVVCGGPNEFQS